MNANTCVICKQPILGYWHEIGKNVICQSCASFTTVYDLYQSGVIDIKPDIIEVEPLVTKDDEKKSSLDDGVRRADEDSNVSN